MPAALEHNLQRESSSREEFEIISTAMLNTAETLRYSWGVAACGARGRKEFLDIG